MIDLKDIIIEQAINIFAFDQARPLLFTQFYFWAFFAVIFAVFCCLKNKVLLRNTFLFFASLFFYFKTSGLFVMLLLLVIVFNYAAGRIIRNKQDRGKHTKWLMISAIIFDLGTLCYYKYAYFFTDIANNILGTNFIVRDVFAEIGNAISGQQRFSIDSIFLPVGISFFTFQAVSYIVDIYKKRIDPVKNLMDFGFYLSFFPQLVAGPIVRASEFIPQLHKKFFLSRRQFGIAVFWILNGLAKKLILSDYLAINLNDRVFENPLLYTPFENLAALFGYSLQVYADFSGYTDIATGVAMLMGFYLPKNFDSPYKAKNAGEFWKRWHISLSTWLKDYLYIPLGGNRKSTFGTYAIIIGIGLLASILSKTWIIAAITATITAIIGAVAYFRPESRKSIRTNLNRMDTMLLGGLWHGASWNFMIWGGLNGVGMLIYQTWKNWNPYIRAIVTADITAALWILAAKTGLPVFRLFFFWSAFTFVGAFVRMIWKAIGDPGNFRFLGNAWAVLQTFVFITFTRLFFRSGSNLDPAEANQAAWDTATNMVTRIGGIWDFSVIPQIIVHYKEVFFLIIMGMIIHWLPDNFKRRYRIAFANLPLAVMVLAVCVAIFIMYQFTSGKLQSFIYFQF